MHKSHVPGLQAPEKHEHDNDQQNCANSARWGITPIAAVRPPRENSQQRQYQDKNQYGSNHRLFLYVNPVRNCSCSPLRRHLCLSTLVAAGGGDSSGLRADCGLVQVNVDRDAIMRIPAVVQIIAVTRVVDVHVIVVIPSVGPVFRPGIGQAEPITAVLKAGISADDNHGVAVNPE
jgi:hypothetical protein